MKTILNLLVLVVLIFTVGCSKDHDAPTFAKYATTAKPTNVLASYDPAGNTVNITWNMADTTNVIDYYVSMSDSSNFNLGHVLTKSVGSNDRSFAFKVDFLPADVDSAVRYFTVSAIYNSEDFNTFIGPYADNPDSALIKID